MESEREDSIDVHETFFLKKQKNHARKKAFPKSVKLYATSTYEDYNHIKVVIGKIFRRVVVCVMVYFSPLGFLGMITKDILIVL